MITFCTSAKYLSSAVLHSGLFASKINIILKFLLFIFKSNAINLESEQNKSICHYVVTHCPCHTRNKDLHSQTELDLDKKHCFYADTTETE